jgi:hypothetical protein
MNPNQTPAQPNHAGGCDRSENLLPEGDEDDGRYDVAEEVNLDEQSDQARGVGKPPAGAAAKAMGAALLGDADDADEDVDQA